MNSLIIFARHPELGRVKTRLAAGIGSEAALAAYRTLLTHTRAVVAPLPVHKTAWLVGENSATAAANWTGFEQLPQPAGDLGQKMQAAFTHDFARPVEAAVIIGTDCPGLLTAHLEEAYAALQTHDLVLGPAADGGYYLLGMNRLHPELFANKPWSTATVRAETLADAARLNLRVHLLPELQDLDTVDDLRSWHQNPASATGPALPHAPQQPAR
ncbi:TIGR04282 family arsenosugar biosynthesis glycosyltransferase [Hymenobacter aerophilus]|uniref:TIGR04282 family arsenosugar biosynthesis glycosyltransferase n=1 Tax=Hymenobacter aerophilus TaxID=119644 RepID=UPI0003741152|nr:TIGR04282 family arsenosugar biosynthesis glycosyltransferase [Hymenobacter aerophilus]